MTRRPLVIYHSPCYDGHTAAWVFRKFRGEEADFVGVNYGKGVEPPDCKGRIVYCLDFCFDRDTMINKVIIPSQSTTVYDHHKTHEAALDGILEEIRHKKGLQRSGDKIVFDVSRSGAGITYDELEREHSKRTGFLTPRHGGRRPLWLVDYIEDRDIWAWKLPDSKAVAAYTTIVPMTFEDWDVLANAKIEDIVERGQAVQAYIEAYGNKACESARMEKIGNYKVPTINIQYMNCSEHVGKLAELHPTAKFAAGYYRSLTGSWKFSLRSRGDFDVSEVALKYGGGGHKAAAGFEVESLPWDK